jgi:hypothetical protein
MDSIFLRATAPNQTVVRNRINVNHDQPVLLGKEMNHKISDFLQNTVDGALKIQIPCTI